jgi:hypothetical protein
MLRGPCGVGETSGRDELSCHSCLAFFGPSNSIKTTDRVKRRVSLSARNLYLESEIGCQNFTHSGIAPHTPDPGSQAERANLETTDARIRFIQRQIRINEAASLGSEKTAGAPPSGDAPDLAPHR